MLLRSKEPGHQQCCWNMVARSPNATHESTGRPKVPPSMVRLATNEFFRFCKIFPNETGHMIPQLSYVRLYLCLNKTRTSIRSFWPFLIDFLVWADYWLTDHPELRGTTQPSTMGGPLGEPGFCIFRSTASAIMILTMLNQNPRIIRSPRVTGFN